MKDDICVCCGAYVPEGRMVCPNCQLTVNKPDCQRCRYRYWLIEMFDIHVDMHDCDKYGQDLCQKMNDPEFIKFMEEQEKNGKDD